MQEDEGHQDEGAVGVAERWRVAAGYGGLVLSPVASGEGAAADSSPFIRSVHKVACRADWAVLK